MHGERMMWWSAATRVKGMKYLRPEHLSLFEIPIEMYSKYLFNHLVITNNV